MSKRLIVGAWLITPAVVCVGAFSFAWLGASLGGRLVWLISGGLMGGLLAVIGWGTLIVFLRKKIAPE